MKRKSIFLLGTILAGAALVGGTFAAWAVTDNAGKIDVDITPGTIESGDTKYVTLEYGTRELVNVEGLGLGKEVGPYKLGLKATTGDGTAFSKGQLELALTGVANEELINYVTVTVTNAAKNPADNEDDAAEKVIATLNGGNPSAKYYPTVTSGQEQLVYFYVSLSSNAVAVYKTIKDQVVTLSVDWNLKSGEEVATSNKYYFDNTGFGWGNVNAYAFGASGENKAWPGVAMTNVKGNIYVLDIDATFTHVIFNGTKNQQSEQYPEVNAAGLALNPSTPCFNSGSKTWGSAPDINAETNYYLVGINDNWTFDSTKKLNSSTSLEGYNFALEGVSIPHGTNIKIAGDDNKWYGINGLTDNNNYYVNEGGIYDVYFNKDKTKDAFKLVLAESAVTYDEYDLDLTTTGWGVDNPAIFVYSWKEGDTSVPNRARLLTDNTKLTVPHDATDFILVRMKTGTTAFAWSGENFYNQSVNLKRDSDTTKTKLQFHGWDDGTNSNSTFNWIAAN